MATLKSTLYSISGKAKGEVVLPAAVFNKPADERLLAQAVRVYLHNKRSGTADTLTRAEVKKTTAKWFRQKGTGRARHGAKSAPIFVGGGTAHGPKSGKVIMKLPEKMKRRALAGALSAKLSQKQIVVVEDLTSIKGKTHEVVNLVSALGFSDKRVGWISGKRDDQVLRSVRNVSNVHSLSPQLVNAYQVLTNEKLIIDSAAVPLLEKRLGGKK